MPELPEVETVRRGLAEAVVGRRVVGVQVTGARTVRRSSPGAVEAGLLGRRFEAAGRRGKYLVLPLDSPAALVVHLRMSGQLLLAPPEAPRPRHTHVVLALDDGLELRFVDPRTFGEVVVVPSGSSLAPEFALLGPDAFDDLGTPDALGRVVTERARQLKYLLTDQRSIAGLGNIYTDEILHRSQLAPGRVSSTLSGGDVHRLHRSLRAVLGAAIEARGSTLGDAQYVDLWGRGGDYQHQHHVYAWAGSRCRRCRGTVERARWGGRSTFWCRGCQR